MLRKLIIIFLLILCLSYLILVHTRGFTPYDEGWLITAGERFLRGEIPYKDFQFIYNPGSIYANALGYLIFGKTILASRLIAILNSLFAISALIFLSKKLKVNFIPTILAISLFIAWGPGHINFVWPVMFSISFGLWATIFFWRASTDNKPLYWFTSGFLAGIVFIFKQNFGLAILISFLFTIFFEKKYRNKKGLLLFILGYVFITGTELLYLIFTNSLNAYLYDFYLLTIVKIGSQGILNSPLPWQYSDPIIKIVVKSIFYFLPMITGLYLCKYIWKKNRSLIIFPLFVISYYLLSIRPTTDYVHLVPLLSLTSILFLVKAKHSPILIFLTISFSLFGFYSSLFLGYYKWNTPLIKQNSFNNMTRFQIWIDNPTRSSMYAIDKFVQTELKDEPSIFIYSFDPIYYFLLNKTNPTRFDYLHEGVLTENSQKEVIKALTQKKLNYIFIDVNLENDKTEIANFIKEQYGPINSVGGLGVWHRKN